MIRKLTRADIPELIAVHLATLPGTLPGRFGERFMELYYSSLLAQPAFFCDGYFHDSRLCGFLAYAGDSGAALGGALRSHFIQYSARLLAAVIARPARALTLLQVAGNLFSLGGRDAATDARAELLSFGVLPEFRRSSEFYARHKVVIGTELLHHAFDTLAAAGARAVRIYIPPERERPFIHKYYREEGFEFVGESPRFGFLSAVYVRQLPEPTVRPDS